MPRLVPLGEQGRSVGKLELLSASGVSVFFVHHWLSDRGQERACAHRRLAESAHAPPLRVQRRSERALAAARKVGIGNRI